MKLIAYVLAALLTAIFLQYIVVGISEAHRVNALRFEVTEKVFDGLHMTTNHEKFVVTVSEQFDHGKPAMMVCLNPLAQRLKDQPDLMKLKGCASEPISGSQLWSDKMFAANKAAHILTDALIRE